MEDGLACIAPGVHHQPVAVLGVAALARQLGGCHEQVPDLLAVLASTETSGGVEVVGVGAAGLAALHAAVLTPAVQALTLDGSLASWQSVVRTPISHN